MGSAENGCIAFQRNVLHSLVLHVISAKNRGQSHRSLQSAGEWRAIGPKNLLAMERAVAEIIFLIQESILLFMPGLSHRFL